MKKIITILMIAFVLVFNTVTVTSALDVKVTVSDSLKGHQYKAYQIVKQALTDNADDVDSIKWGNDINGEDFFEDLRGGKVYGKRFENCYYASDVAKILRLAGDKSEVGKYAAATAYRHIKGNGIALSEGINKFESDSGYYLIVDLFELNDENLSEKLKIMYVTDTIEIKAQSNNPSVEIKVMENSRYGYDDGYGEGYNDVADYSMADTVNFRIIGTVPDITEYSTYKYAFNVSLANGFDIAESDKMKNDIRVYLSDDKNLLNKKDITDSFNTDFVQTESERKISISCNNIKKTDGVEKDKFIIVEYKTVLLSNAAVGLDGNIARASLEYSNNPDKSGELDNETTKTDEDSAIVFTYALDINSVDKNDATKRISNAVFQLKNSVGEYAVVTGDAVTDWTMNKDNPATQFNTDTKGNIRVTGLDQGDYTLIETKAPTGYKLPTEPFAVEIIAATHNRQTWSGDPSDALTDLAAAIGDMAGSEADTNKGIVGVKAENSSNSNITEGMNTITVILTASVLIIAVAVIIFAVKKRARK